ncbi:calcium-activated BK potassium channel [Cavenderia fasciculata]|uniref:Calcium-activated BK potassium channel n=1 Tax=Cavenderia fasciculata TaxID=261658 RepID=F4Q917_CACFS|nr:calcium-activated BK potassium channel [Cavenderia fasciculata]EGG15186.1 calcium-activated BK potassium channel [Cavenderia fasciculata]|eukprot:XP_004351906.1 calcium-activated BK potassium channel [Cavenderia fasciculata]
MNSTESISSISSSQDETNPLETGPIGGLGIWNNMLKLGLAIVVVMTLLIVSIVLVRIFKRRDKRGSLKVSFRSKAEIYLAYTHVGEIIEFAQVMFSIVSVCLFIYGNYLDDPPYWYLVMRYVFSFFSLVDLITILPILIDILTGNFKNILKTFQFLRVLRVLRVLRLSRILHIFKNEVTKYTFKAFIVVFTFIMVLAGFYMNIEKKPGDGSSLKFHETVYFLVVTLATVGYGDIYPTTALGQVTITVALSVGAGVLIPYHVSKLMEKLQQDSPFLRNLSSTSVTGHVFLCGEFSITHLMDFLSEFYHQRNGKLKKEVVLLCPKAPDDQLKALLLHPFYKNRLIYLQGSPLFEQDLERTKLSKADACFISLPPSWESGDTDNILCSYAVKSMNKNIKIFSHLVTSKNKNKAPFLKGTICMEEFRSALLAQSIICPGYNVLFSNLFTSRNIPNIVSEKWLTEYYYGCNNSVYILKVPEFLVGETLTDVTLSMYFGNGSLLIGLFVPDCTTPPGCRGKFYLYPNNSTVIRKEMSMVVISHTIVQSRDLQSTNEQNQPYDYTLGMFGLGKKVTSFISRLAVPDIELLINEAEAPQESQDQIMNETLKTFIGATSKPLAFLPRQNSMIRMDTSDHISEELDNEGIFEYKDDTDEELSPKDLVKNLCLAEYEGDWIALLSDISNQKTGNPNIEKIQERIKFIIDKHSLLTFTLHGKFDKNKDGSQKMKGHMLIVCQTLKGLDLLLHHLRLPYVTSIKTNKLARTGLQPIVVLYRDEPEDGWFESVTSLPLIAFIKGSSANHSDLEKCGTKHAETIIIASNPYQDVDSDQVDSFTLMSYVDIMRCNHKATIITELLHEPNIRFLEDRSIKCAGSNKKFQSYLQANRENTFLKPDFFSTSHYSCGRVATYAVLNSLVVQSHFNEAIADVANELAFGVNNLAQNHQVLGLNPNLTNPDSKSFSKLVKLPPIYHGRTYGELLKVFLQQKNILILGLYRSSKPMNSPAPYVFTCPHPTTVLHEDDQIFTISSLPIN